MMKHVLYYLLVICLVFVTSCKKDLKEPEQESVKKEVKKVTPDFLPFTTINLNDLSGFKPTGVNWTVVGNVIADRNKEKTFYPEEGSGILFNANDQEYNKHIFSDFDHGDIELELDVMMPIKSNSGIYFQGRYEIQLLDSWGVEKPKHGDIGGIYQRWNKDAEKGKEGYEGHPPRINAAKAPGLWQHFKIIFHAPKFDKSGKKTKNAWFEEVWLNGVLLHKNVELTGPTRAAAFSDEKPRGSIMIQGDHGPVAFKNIKYKLYEDNKLVLSNIIRTEYGKVETSNNLDTIPKVKEESVEKFTLTDVTKERIQKLVVHSGTMSIPETGEYFFEGRSTGVGELFINNKKVLTIQGGMNTPRITTTKLEKGNVPFKIMYNQNKPWAGGFSLHGEGPNMQKYSLQEGVWKSANKFDPLSGIIIDPKDKPVMQRSFVNHEGEKHTHCISVGTPQGIHYSYNLATGSLLKVWDGSFLNTTHMWLSRGYKQLGEPIGFAISLHGGLEFASLDEDDSPWPLPLPENKDVKQLGYELDDSRMPSFLYQIGKSTITNKFTVSESGRQLNKSITISKGKNLWHKIADGESIKALPDNIYVINNEGYYIDFTGNDLNPIIRNIDGIDELLVEIPKRDSSINYSIIW